MKLLSFVFIVPLTCVLLKADHSRTAKPGDNLGDQLGTIQFEVSGNDAARAHVVRGVKLLHHMMYIEAEREFASATAADPRCALAHWGRAMTIIHPLWPDVPTATELAQGAEHIRAGVAANPPTPRERAYLSAMDSYFRDEGKRDHPAKLKALDEAWQRLASEYPDDLDAVAFSALFHLAPARFVAKDKSHRIQTEAAMALEKVLARIPDHPGAQHYKIHAYDFPMLADRALEICDRYGAIAPDVPHALHMPTHIFTRRGLWDKSIEFNRRSADAARKLGESAGETNMHYAHALDYLAYAYLQRGQFRSADAIRREVLALTGPYVAANRAAMAFAFAAIPARYALERRDWSAAAKLEPRQPVAFPWNDQFLHCDGITQFARTIGAARSGDLDTAERGLAEQERLSRIIAKAYPQPYWRSQAEAQVLAGRGWVLFKRGQHEEAVALLQRAAELEATADKEAVTPGEVVPARELLGDMLLEAERPREALAAYEAVLEVSPNRLNALHGAGRAAELARDGEKAVQHYRALLTVASAADPGLEAVQQASAFLATRTARRAE